ncbi:MAG: hypothetical protein M3Q24_00330 [bacterium]|nr:hypothetical protein [bacterium]
MEKDENKNIILKEADIKAPDGALRYFSNDSNFVFILKKTEKLSSALYLITSFFDKEEPLKWALRSLAGKLLSSSLLLKDPLSSRKEETIIETEGIILEIESTLLVAKNAGLISEMNHKIISKEFTLFAESLSAISENLNQVKVKNINAEYFKVSVAEPKVNEEKRPSTARNNDLNIENDSDNNTSEPIQLNVLNDLQNKAGELSLSDKSQKIDESVLARSPHNKTFNNNKNTQGLKEFGAVAVKKNSRQSIIITLLRRKKEIMIKDVSPLIHGCSEKTIQRELLSMVDKGILKKQGEKRWSKYSLS